MNELINREHMYRIAFRLFYLKSRLRLLFIYLLIWITIFNIKLAIFCPGFKKQSEFVVFFRKVSNFLPSKLIIRIFLFTNSKIFRTIQTQFADWYGIADISKYVCSSSLLDRVCSQKFKIHLSTQFFLYQICIIKWEKTHRFLLPMWVYFLCSYSLAVGTWRKTFVLQNDECKCNIIFVWLDISNCKIATEHESFMHRFEQISWHAIVYIWYSWKSTREVCSISMDTKPLFSPLNSSAFW